MEAIKGSDVNVPDAVFAWLLDGRGGVKPLEDNDVIDSQHPCWLHLNYTHPGQRPLVGFNAFTPQ